MKIWIFVALLAFALVDLSLQDDEGFWGIADDVVRSGGRGKRELLLPLDSRHSRVHIPSPYIPPPIFVKRSSTPMDTNVDQISDIASFKRDIYDDLKLVQTTDDIKSPKLESRDKRGCRKRGATISCSVSISSRSIPFDEISQEILKVKRACKRGVSGQCSITVTFD